MRFGTTLALALTTILVAAPPAAAVDRLVATDGEDTGDCTGAPCLTVGYAVSQSVGGDTVRVEAGTYNECVDASSIVLAFVADDTDGDVVLDGGRVCGGLMCDGNPGLDCLSDAGCTGTCDLDGGTDGTCSNDASVDCVEEACVIPEGETAGTCETSGAVCESDQDCADAQCDFGTCVAPRECSDDGEPCLVDGDCVSGTCDPVAPFPVLRLASGSSLTGFTIRNGGDSGVVLEGSGDISENVIENNRTAAKGGGVYVNTFLGSGAGAGDAERCFLRPSEACDSTGINPCSTCEDRSGLVCSDDTGCSGTCDLDDETSGTCSHDSSATCEAETCVIDDGDTTGTCASSGITCDDDQVCADAQCDFGACEVGVIGPCLSGYMATVDDNEIRDNSAQDGGGVGVDLGSLTSGIANHVVITSNLVEGNEAAGFGGGIEVSAYQYGSKRAEIADNTVTDNTATWGGGLEWASVGTSDLTEFVITTNAIDGNEATGFGGGMYGYAYAYAYAEERHTVEQNVVTNNLAVYGGGIYASLFNESYPADVQMEIVSNSVTHNESSGEGGGLSVYLGVGYAAAGPASIEVRDNAVSGNTSAANGGGMIAWLQAWEANPDAALRVTGNTVLGNTSEASAGGVGITAVVDAPGPGASLEFDHNLVADNVANGSDSLGGGVLAYLEAASGPVTLETSFNTYIENHCAFGGAGLDLEPDAATGQTVDVTVTDSIFLDNQGAGLGGVASGDGVSTVTLDYTLFYGNGSPWERTLADMLVVPDMDNLIFEDPLMSVNYELGICSPAVDAADPSADYSLEPQPNGLRANMGYLGGTARARTSLADTNLDGEVDGKDILVLSTSFGADSAHPRYIVSADLDANGIVDGDDLALVGAGFGSDCTDGGTD